MTRIRVALIAVAVAAGCSDPVSPRVEPWVASIIVTPDSLSIGIGRTLQMTATIHDLVGAVIRGRPVAWSTSDSSLATVSDSGLVTAREAGQVVVTATVQSVSGTATLVVLTPVALVLVSPSAAILVPDGSLDFGVELHGPLFQPLNDRFVTWTINDSTVATVSPSGQVHGVTQGSTTLTARSEGITSSPVTVSITRPTFTALATGSNANHSCGITVAGALFCWGSNYIGQLGIGIADRGQGYSSGRLFPTGIVEPQTFLDVALGDYFTCGIANSPLPGTPYCWGGGGDGTLGNGGVASSLVPAPVQTGLAFESISSGWNHSCALTPDSSAYCWGRPPGIGTSDFPGPRAFTPMAVDGGLKFRMLGTGAHLTCGLSADSLAYCWGHIIGNDTATNIFGGPYSVSGGHRYVTLAVGDGHGHRTDPRFREPRLRVTHGRLRSYLWHHFRRSSVLLGRQRLRTTWHGSQPDLFWAAVQHITDAGHGWSDLPVSVGWLGSRLRSHDRGYRILLGRQ